MPKESNTCGDCGVKEGEIHEFGCDMEVCPFCGGQLLGCPCIFKELGEDKEKYSQLMPEILIDDWIEVLEKKGRIPYIMWPNICAKCGKLWPNMKMVSDEEWEYYIQSDMRREMVCTKCWRKIKALIDKNKE